MTLRGLPILVCLLLALGTSTSALGAPGGGGSGSGGGTGSGGGGGYGAANGDDPSGPTGPQDAARPYSLRAIYFRRDQFKTAADCLAAARTQRLPPDVCQ
ncbi:MAG: hypothetical protein K2X72_15550 [Reyranella sp.]|nr:hypothetical protein [Reyranella sp.]